MRSRTSRSVEFLAATDKDQFTPTGSGNWPSFTKVLMREMKEMITRDALVTISALHKRMVEEKAGLQRQPFYVCLTEDNCGGTIKLTKLGEAAVIADCSHSTATLNSIYLRLSLFDEIGSAESMSMLKWLTKDAPSSIEDIKLVDHIFGETKEVVDLGVDLLHNHPHAGGNLLPFLSKEGRKEAQKLLGDLRAALCNPAPAVPGNLNLRNIIDDVKESSSNLVAFVADTLTNLDPNMLEKLAADGSLASGDLKSRISMRLTLIGNDLPDNNIRVNFDDPACDGQRLRLGKRNSDPVLVEYIYYEDLSQDISDRQRQQVGRISALLTEPKNASFRCFQAVGFSHEILVGPRFGIVYSLPDCLVDQKFMLLSDLMAQVKTVPLEVRVRAACSLCDAVLHLHSIGWFHKNIRSDNVLVFTKTGREGNSSVDWDFPNPYIIGFDCSRPSEAETRGTVDFNIKDNIYRHPDRWGRSAPFKKQHDLYSLVSVLKMSLGL